MQNIQTMKYIPLRYMYLVLYVIQVLNFIVHKEFSGTSLSECLMYIGLKVKCTWVADGVQSLVHTCVWRSAHGLHFMLSVSLASLSL